MANEKSKRPPVDKELEALRAATATPRSKEATEALQKAVQSPRGLVVARAASMIKEHRLENFQTELVAAFARFLQNPIKSDPGCLAKLAILEALDFTEYDEHEPFLIAVRCVQEEKAWGPKIDTAAGLRARAIVALARLGYQSLSLLAAELLTDPEAPARQAAVEALTMSGAQSNAALLLFKLRVGDKEPLITLACMSGLLSLTPEWALTVLKPLLFGADESLRELAALSLGDSRQEAALALLLENLGATVISRERAVVLRAIGLHRSERALQTLLATISEGSTPDARAAVEALGVRRFETGVREKAHEAAQKNEKISLTEILARAFPSDS